MQTIDLRSDTVTLPTPAMRRAMAEAEVGDDVSGEDPTVNRLEALAAAMLGKEAGLFVASGTMSNLLAVLTHCARGDEIVMGSEAHIFHYEVAGVSAIGGVQVRLVPNDAGGRLPPDLLEAAIRPLGNIHYPRTSLICLENTHNRCGGAALTPADLAESWEVAKRHDLAVHLDGARIFNAAVFLGVEARELAKYADSVGFCLSKGLSAPVGSVLCGTKEYIARARKYRKMVGGGMRQAGVIAAAGIVALEQMIDRLAEDHENARRLAQGLAEIRGVELSPAVVQTNIVGIRVAGPSAEEVQRRLAERGLRVSFIDRQRLRLVTHFGIGPADVDEAVGRVAAVIADL